MSRNRATDVGDYKPVRLSLVTPAEWAGQPVPDREWIVPEFIPARQVTMFGGDGGGGKTLLALQLMVSAGVGQKWLGQHVVPCKSFGLFCEDDLGELHRRLADIARHYGVDLADLGDIELVSRVAIDSLLAHFPRFGGTEATDLYGTIVNHVIGSGARLVVLDSLHDIFGGNEIDRVQARQFISLLRELAVEIDGAVVVTSHPSVAGRNSGSGESGSTAWSNAVRSRLYLTRDNDERDRRVLRRMKSNYAAVGDDIEMTWRNGVFVADNVSTGIVGAIRKRTAEGAFVECLRRLEEQGRKVNASRNTSTYAPRSMAGMHEAKGYSERDLSRAMDRLFDRDAIKVVEEGPPSRPRSRIVFVEESSDASS